MPDANSAPIAPAPPAPPTTPPQESPVTTTPTAPPEPTRAAPPAPDLDAIRAEAERAAVRGEPSPVERRCHLLAANGWKGERQDRIVGHGGCGSACLCEWAGFDTQSLNTISTLRDTRQRIPAMR